MKRELQQHGLLIYIFLNTATSANWHCHNAHYNEGDSYTGELCKLLTSRCFQVREQSGPASLAHEVHHKCLTSGGCGSPCSWHGNLHGFCKHTERGVCVCCLKNVMWCDLCLAYLGCLYWSCKYMHELQILWLKLIRKTKRINKYVNII